MESRETRVKQLLAQRAAIDEKLDAIDAEIRAEHQAFNALRKSRKPRRQKHQDVGDENGSV